MALKILICDPDAEWLARAREYFTTCGYVVSAVSNGKDAQLAIYNDKFFAVLLARETQSHSGIQVLKFIKSNSTNQRVIFIVGNRDRDEDSKSESEKFVKMGATEVLYRPFELEELKELLEGHQSLGDLVAGLPKNQGSSDEEEVSAQDDEFTSIRIDDFYSAQAVLFDIYIKLNTERYVKILHAGDTFEKKRIDKYKIEKKVEYLYFHKNDRRKFIQFNNFMASKMVENAAIDQDTKVRVMKNISEKYVEEAFVQGLKPQIIDQGREVCENIYKMIEKEKDIYKLLRSYQDFDPSAYNHAFLVSLFSTAIIKQFEWESKVTIESAAMACMFHDIGKMKLPRELLEKRPIDMSDQEIQLYQKHPELGFEIADSNRMLNNSVKQIILQHHEAFDGTGFPFKKRGNKILTLANIVALADSFTHIMVDSKVTPVEALRVLLGRQEDVAKYNSLIIENFIKVFVDPSKVVKEAALPSNSRVVNKKVS